MTPARNSDEIRGTIVTLLSEIAGIDADRITDDATIDGELQMDSVKFVELQVAIEETYDIELDIVELVELNRFGPMVDYIVQLTRRDRP